MEKLEGHAVAVLGLLVGSIVVGAYRILVYPVAGSPVLAVVYYASTMMWPFLLVYLAVVAVTRLASGRPTSVEHPGRLALEVAVSVAAAAFFATNGLSARLWLGLAAASSAGSGTLTMAMVAGTRFGRRARRRLTLAAAAGAMLCASVVLIPFGSPSDLSGLGSLGPDELTGRSFVVLAADGMDWELLQRFIEEGRLPNLANMRETALVGALHTIRPTSSPFIWNSIYTGFSPALHLRRPVYYAISSNTFLGTFPTDYPDPIDLVLSRLKPSLRQPRAMWDVLGAVGYDVAVLGSWEQLPVPRTGKAFLSRQFEFSPNGAPYAVPDTDPRTVWIAPALEKTLESARASARDIPEGEWHGLVGGSFDLRRLFEAQLRPEDLDAVVESRLARLRAAYLTDRFRVQSGRSLLKRLAQPFFLWLYINGIDTSQHSYSHQLRGVEDPAEPKDVVARYYEIVDDWIGRVREDVPPGTVVVLVSDHGIDAEVEVVSDNEVYKTGIHPYAPHGVLMIDGVEGGGGNISSVHVFDVAPTILALAGVPNLAAGEGRVVSELDARTPLVADWRTLARTTYAMGNPEFGDPELIEQLRQLGYIR